MNTLFRFFPSPTCIIRECALVPIKNKPTFLPSFDFPAHFDEESPAGLLCDGHVVTGVDIVASGLHVAPQIEVFLPDRQIACQRSGLEEGKPMVLETSYVLRLDQRGRSRKQLKSLSIKMPM